MRDGDATWLPGSWRRALLVGFPLAVVKKVQTLLDAVADESVDGAIVAAAAKPNILERPGHLRPGDLLLLAQQLTPRLSAFEWLASLRRADIETPAIVLVAGAPSPPPPQLAPLDVLPRKGLGVHALTRSLGYLRQSAGDSRISDEVRRRLRALGASRTEDDEHSRLLELAGAYRAQFEEKEGELGQASRRIAELEAALAGLEARPPGPKAARTLETGANPEAKTKRLSDGTTDNPTHAPTEQLDPAFLAQRVRFLETELEQCDGLRRGQEAAIVELRRRLGEGDDPSLPGGVADLTARLMVSEWMRTTQLQSSHYLQQRLDHLEGHFKALGALFETPQDAQELDPSELLSKVGDRLTRYERQRSVQQGTIDRLSHSLAVQQVDDTFDDAQSRRNVLHRLNDALAYARANDTPLTCLLTAIDQPERLRQEHGSVAYDYVLVQVAQRLKLTLRHRDVLLRYDHESFVLLTDTASCPAAYNHAIRLVGEVGAMPVELGRRQIAVSISVAITLRHPSMDEGTDLFRRAQVVLQKAKAWGTAQVAIDPRSVRHEKSAGDDEQEGPSRSAKSANDKTPPPAGNPTANT